MSHNYLTPDSDIEEMVRSSLLNWFFARASDADTKETIQKQVVATFNQFQLREWRVIVAETVKYAGTKHLLDVAAYYRPIQPPSKQ